MPEYNVYVEDLICVTADDEKEAKKKARQIIVKNASGIPLDVELVEE